MLEKLRIARSRFESDEDAVLAEAVQNVQRATDPLTDDERVVYDADQLLGSIMMDDLTTALDALDEQFFGWMREDADNLEVRTRRYVREHLDAFVTLE